MYTTTNVHAASPCTTLNQPTWWPHSNPSPQYPLVFSLSFSSSSPISLFVVHNSTIIAEYKVKLSLSISLRHDHEFTWSTALHPLQHTPSAAYTQCSIHPVHHIPGAEYNVCSIQRVQHTPSLAYTECNIHRVLHAPSSAYTEGSIHRVQHTSQIVCHPLILTIASWLRNVASASGIPPYRLTATIQLCRKFSKVKPPRHIPTVSSLLDLHLQTHLELLSSTAYRESRYTMCREVVI